MPEHCTLGMQRTSIMKQRKTPLVADALGRRHRSSSPALDAAPMRATCLCLGAPRGPLRPAPRDAPGKPSRKLTLRRVPKPAAPTPAYVTPHQFLPRLHKVPAHPTLPPMAARVAAPLPSSSSGFSPDTGFYTPRDPSLPVLRALPIKTTHVHVPVYPFLHGLDEYHERQVIAVPSGIFDADERPSCVHTAVVSFLASTRSHLATNKSRSRVHGSGRKRRPQKGTGRARMSDTTAPQLRHGARAHPKSAYRNWKRGIPGNAWVAAMRVALSMRWRDGSIACVDGLPTFTGQGVPGFHAGIPVAVMRHKAPEHELQRMLEARGMWGGAGTLFLLGHDVADWHEGHLRLRATTKCRGGTGRKPSRLAREGLLVGTKFVHAARRLRRHGVDVKRAVDVNIVELLRYRRILFDARGLGDLVARLQSDRGLLGSEVWPLRDALTAAHPEDGPPPVDDYDGDEYDDDDEDDDDDEEPVQLDAAEAAELEVEAQELLSKRDRSGIDWSPRATTSTAATSGMVEDAARRAPTERPSL